MAIFYNPPDLNFVLLATVFVISSIATVLAIRNYFKIKSIDFILMAILFFSYTYWSFHHILTYGIYFPFQPAITAMANQCWVGTPCYFELMYIHVFLLQITWSAGWLALFIHTVRAIDIRKRNIIVKLLTGIIAIESVALYIYINLHAILILITQDTTYLDCNANGCGFYSDGYWYLQLWISRLFFDGVTAMNIDLIMLYGFVFVSFLFVKPVVKSREIRIIKYLWLILPLALGFTYVQYLAMFNPFVGNSFLNVFGRYVESFEMFLRVLYILWFVAFVPIGILITLFPQGLLMSEYQILRAHNLYKLTKSETTGNRFAILNPLSQIKGYVEKLPESIRTSIGAD